MPSDSIGEFELLVLLAAVRLGADHAYTVSIAREINERTGRLVRRASVYISLQRLEAKGMVRSHMGGPKPERDGRRPRLVTVTPKGIAAVRAATGAIQAMMGDLAGEIG